MPIWTVVSWNLLGREQRHVDRVAERLREMAPDVVALQETRPGQARTLARLLGWNVAWRRKHSPYTGVMWWRREGLALLSPHALQRVTSHVLSPGVPVRSYRRRIVVAGDVCRGDDVLRVYDTHLSSDDATERVEQARRLAAIVRAEASARRVLCGDLNTQTDEPEVLRELRPLDVVDHGTDPTEPANRPAKRLDYVLVPVDAVEVTVVSPEPGDDWRELSDHLPVIATFTLP